MSVALRSHLRRPLVDLRLLRKITRHLLQTCAPARWELGLHLVDGPKMARLNETYLQHSGPTDVITFDYSETPRCSPADPVHGEIFICLDVARRQALEFHTTWPAELVRYLVHGVLHLLGHDDLDPVSRRKMKREENRLTRALAAEFSFASLERKGQ